MILVATVGNLTVIDARHCLSGRGCGLASAYGIG